MRTRGRKRARIPYVAAQVRKRTHTHASSLNRTNACPEARTRSADLESPQMMEMIRDGEEVATLMSVGQKLLGRRQARLRKIIPRCRGYAHLP
eukprot:6188418-Pleurochrysis_carterae.AAC.2